MKSADYTPERRPLAARNWNASHAAARWLAARGVAPNAISVGGLIASLGAGTALALSCESSRPSLWLVIGCSLILMRGMCNMLDGMVAVSTGKASRAGELFNEVPAIANKNEWLSGEHFSVDGTLIQAWASHKSFARKDGSDDDTGNFKNKKRSNDTTSPPPMQTHGFTASARPPPSCASWATHCAITATA